MHLSGERINVIPWEERARFTAWDGLCTSWVFIITKPVEFFSKISAYKGKRYPLLFGMLISGFSLLWQLVISLTFRSDAVIRELSKMNVAINKPELVSSVFFIILFFPLFYIVINYLLSGFMYAAVYLLQGVRNFDTTFRVVNYSLAASVFSILPILGIFISCIWYFALVTIGIKIAHRLNWYKTAAAVLGVYVLFLLVWILFSFMAAR